MNVLPFTAPELVDLTAGADAAVDAARRDVVAGLRALGRLVRHLERAPVLLTPTVGARVAQACAAIAALEESAGGAALNVACMVVRLDRAWRCVPAPQAHRASWLAVAWAAVGAREGALACAREALTGAPAQGDVVPVARALHAVRRRFGTACLPLASASA